MNLKRALLLALLSANLPMTASVHAQDLSRLGGDLTSTRSPQVALELPAPNVRSDEFFKYHLQGHSDFHSSFETTKNQGKLILGPAFNHVSCGGCHVRDGRGPVRFARKPPGSAMLLKVGLRGRNRDGSAKDVPGVGEQLQDHTITGGSQYNIHLNWKETRGVYRDRTPYSLRRPALSFKVPSYSSSKLVYSLRMTPPVVGMGLLEAVPEETIEALADAHDRDGDGISGRVNFVIDRETGKKSVGRFGFKASHPTLKQQSGAAFFHDMGISNELFPGEDGSEELQRETMERIVYYLQAAGVPTARDQDDPDVSAGKEIFQRLNCQGCHVMTLRTGNSDVVEVANQEFHPFTDLLLHDMGADLADTRPEFSASAREWRTTPLWGIGLHPFLTNEKPGYLHDGRARTLDEAILWHGGEALASRNKFKALKSNERFQLVRFLQSL